MLTKEQCVSVTQLARQASEIVRRSQKGGLQYIFVNNKPCAAIVSLETLRELETGTPVEVGTLEWADLSPETQQAVIRSRQLAKTDFINF